MSDRRLHPLVIGARHVSIPIAQSLACAVVRREVADLSGKGLDVGRLNETFPWK